MRKEHSVGVIYRCKGTSKKLICNREKLHRRLQRAIEDMAEDGLKNFILPLSDSNPFASCFVDAFVAAKALNLDIRLTIMLDDETDDSFEKSPAQRLIAYTRYADEVSYNKSREIDNMLSLCSALIIYYEGLFGQLNYIIHEVQRDCRRFININL